MVTHWLMSFGDTTTGKNLGCCVVKSSSGIQAHKLSHQLGINPGGEMRSYGLTTEQFEEQGLEVNRLYTRAEMLQMGFKL
tara:strand:+ start:156 stop:395 length:240 start_codon:yes stop_codon:yes gene_type:complete